MKRFGTEQIIGHWTYINVDTQSSFYYTELEFCQENFDPDDYLYTPGRWMFRHQKDATLFGLRFAS